MKETWAEGLAVCGAIPVIDPLLKVSRNKGGTIEWRRYIGTKWERVITARPIDKPEIVDGYVDQTWPDGTRERVWHPRYADMRLYEGRLFLITKNISLHSPR